MTHPKQCIVQLYGILTAKDVDAAGIEEPLEKANITIDISRLEEAMKLKKAGEYTCTAYATDVAGNKSVAVEIKVMYERKDVENPVITVVKLPDRMTVDLTGITKDTERLEVVLDAAKKALVLGEHYNITDDYSVIEKISTQLNDPPKIVYRSTK